MAADRPDSVLGALDPAQESWRAQREDDVLPQLVRSGRLWWLWTALVVLLAAVAVVVIAVGVRV
jgi:hypothetical protein